MAAERIDTDGLEARLAPWARAEAPRRLVALVGPPGVGKSTLAARLAARLGPGAAVLEQDGFHLDDTLLEARGLRPHKGAPATFDVGGLATMLERLRADAEAEVIAPRFDRTLEIARAGAQPIDRTARLVIVEGNYLALDAAPWDRLAGLFDLTIALEAPEPTLRARLMARWAGLEAALAARKVEGNDLPNGRLVQARSRPADLVLRSDGAAA